MRYPCLEGREFPVALRHHAELSDPQRIQIEIRVAPRALICFVGMIPAESELIKDTRADNVNPMRGPSGGLHRVGLGEVGVSGRLRTRLAIPQPPHEYFVILSEGVVDAPEVLVRTDDDGHRYSHIVLERVRRGG